MNTNPEPNHPYIASNKADARQPKAPQSTATTAPPVKLVPANEVKPQRLDWLWEGYIAKRSISIIAGKPGTGKTTIALDLAARISSGRRFPDSATPVIGTTLIWSGEDPMSTRNYADISCRSRNGSH